LVDNHTQTVCLVPGPIHLFWTTGVYFFFDLIEEYDVILVVDSNYKKDRKFKKVVKLAHSIYYLEENHKNLFTQHKQYYETSKNVIKKHKPKFVFQHNHVCPFNIYLFNMSKKMGAYNISFQNGFQHECPQTEHLILKANHISLIKQHSRLRSMQPVWLIWLRVTLREIYSYYFNYYLIPILLTKKPLWTPFDPVRHSIKRGIRRHNHYDLRLVYTNEEEIKTLTENAKNILQIKNPILDNYREVQKYIYEDTPRMKNRIIILPDGATSDYLFLEKKLKSNDTILLLTEKWTKVIKIISKKFTNYEIGIKLHPKQENDKIWQQVISNLKKVYQNLVNYPVREDASRLVIESKIVVAEASTVLWFASNLEKDRILISLNLFDLPLADAFASDQRINYFESLNNLKKFALKRVGNAQTNKHQTLNNLLKNLDN